jgi:hypothetical protein
LRSALRRARDDQPDVALGETAEQRGRREKDEAAHEHAPPAHEIRKASAEKQEAAERQRVGIDHPREVVLREVERGADGGQRHVHDRGVKDDHELRDRQQRQSQVLGSCV